MKLLRYFFLALMLLFIQATYAQVSNYGFSQTSTFADENGTTYIFNNDGGSGPIDTNITRYFFLNTGGSIKDTVAAGPGYPIGFNFMYNGLTFDRLGISGNMYIKLGNSTNGNLSMYNDSIAGGVFAAGRNTLRSNVISIFQSDYTLFENFPLALSYGLFGYPGNRSFKVNYTYDKYFSGYPFTMYASIVLNEWNNTIDLVYYGPIYALYGWPSTTQSIFCGLRGSDQSDFSSRKVTSGVNTWETSLPGILAADKCDFNQTLFPSYLSDSGLLYQFTPPYTPAAPHCPEAYFTALQAGNPGYLPADYPVTGVIQNGYFPAANAVEVPTNSVLNWSPEYSTDTIYYDVYLGLDSLDLNLLGSNITVTSLQLPTLAANTRYFYKVVAHDTYGSSPDCVHSFTTDSTLSYCNPPIGNSSYQTITLNTFSYTYPGGTEDSRGQFEATAPYTTTLQRGSSYTLHYTPIVGVGCFAFKCWIDFNQNGVLDDPGEEFQTDINNNATIVVPVNAVLGQTKMRIRTTYGCAPETFTPCSVNGGQDFIITIGPAVGCESLLVDTSLVNLPCHGDSTGNIALGITGGSAPYHITWQKNMAPYSDTTAVIDSLSSGTYQATVTDAIGCNVTTPLIAVANSYTGNCSTDTPVNCTGFALDTFIVIRPCHGDSTGSIALNVTGGITPYSVAWQKNMATYNDTTTVINNLSNGVYQATIKDAAGCSITSPAITVTGNPNDSCTAQIPPPSDSINQNYVQVYPNPSAGGVFTVSLPQSMSGLITTAVIMDLQGRIVKQLTVSSVLLFKIDLSAQSSGIYILKVANKQQSQVIKLVNK
jgi:hypothetical protein